MDTLQKNSFSVIISTCDKFSDLWQGNIHLLNENWADRNANTYLVTDKVRDDVFDNVTLVCAGEDKEITERLKVALKYIDTEYIVFLLDDYFLTEKIDNSKILKDIEFMSKYNMDYLCLFKTSKHALRKEKSQKVKDYPGIYSRNISRGSYKVILYPGIWRKDFMEKTLNVKRNAWQYEVALTSMARELNAKCSISNNGELPFLDVIRKGKLLRKANRYFKKNPVYISERELMSAKDEWIIEIRSFLREWLPEFLFKSAKKFMIKRGHTYYSPIDE